MAKKKSGTKQGKSSGSGAAHVRSNGDSQQAAGGSQRRTVLHHLKMLKIEHIIVTAAAFIIIVLLLAQRSGNNNGGGSMNPTATIETEKGTITLELFRDKAPKTAGNFITLAKKGYYDGIIFHRVIDNFMIQTGDPTGTGRGGPGYAIPDEFGAGLKHSSQGMLSMANAGPNTGGSQFFITLAPAPWLDGKHAIFGKVITGMDIVQAIGKTPVGQGDRPISDIHMIKVTINE